MKPDAASSALPPDTIGDYRVSHALSPGQTLLALGPGDRQVVIKIMEQDCLLRGQLHPSIRERLARVRELAHRGVANLYGVERCDGHVFAVWEYVAGQSVDRYAAKLTKAEELSALGREIVLTVEALHSLGIVHGSLHAGNIIVTDLSQVCLTHISPLLYDDPNNDLHDLISLLSDLFTKCGRGDLPVVKSIESATSLAQLRMKLTNSTEPKEAAVPHPGRDPSPRRRALLAAAITAAAGSVIAYGIIHGAGKTTQGKPVPPEAPAAAMESAGK